MKGLPPLARWISSAASAAEADTDVFATRRAVPEALSGSSCQRVVDGWRAISASRAGARRGATEPAVSTTAIGRAADPFGQVEKEPEALLVRQVRVVDQEDER